LLYKSKKNSNASKTWQMEDVFNVPPWFAAQAMEYYQQQQAA